MSGGHHPFHERAAKFEANLPRTKHLRRNARPDDDGGEEHAADELRQQSPGQVTPSRGVMRPGEYRGLLLVCLVAAPQSRASA
jgi:hypothetical protein